MYPGQMPSIKKNLFNIILLLDLTNIENLTFLGGTMSAIIERQYPIRFGLVPSVESDESKRMARLVYYVIRNHGRRRAMLFVKNIVLVSNLLINHCACYIN